MASVALWRLDWERTGWWLWLLDVVGVRERGLRWDVGTTDTGKMGKITEMEKQYRVEPVEAGSWFKTTRTASRRVLIRLERRSNEAQQDKASGEAKEAIEGSVSGDELKFAR